MALPCDRGREGRPLHQPRTVLGVGINGADATDTDPAVYVGSTVDFQLHIAKAVNGADADTAPLVVSVGTPLTFTYAVWTTGTAALTVNGVMDDNGTTGTSADDFPAAAVLVQGGFNIGDTDRDGLLDPGEVWRYVSPVGLGLVAFSGDYVNVGLVTATAADGRTFAQNSAWVRGTTGIVIKKFVNGQDADTRPVRPFRSARRLYGPTRCATRAGSRWDPSWWSTTEDRTPRSLVHGRGHERQRPAGSQRGLDLPRHRHRGPRTVPEHGDGDGPHVDG